MTHGLRFERALTVVLGTRVLDVEALKGHKPDQHEDRNGRPQYRDLQCGPFPTHVHEDQYDTTGFQHHE